MRRICWVLIPCVAVVALLCVSGPARADEWKYANGYWYFWSDAEQEWYYHDGENWYCHDGDTWYRTSGDDWYAYEPASGAWVTANDYRRHYPHRVRHAHRHAHHRHHVHHGHHYPHAHHWHHAHQAHHAHQGHHGHGGHHR